MADPVKNNNPVVLFDGVCNFCNAMVNFVIRNDKEGKIKFASLQSAFGETLIREYVVPENIDSILLLENGIIHTKSAAAFKIASYLSYPAKALSLLKIFPSFISNSVYDVIARNRYKWFGKKDQCMVPSAEIRSRFIEV